MISHTKSDVGTLNDGTRSFSTKNSYLGVFLEISNKDLIVAMSSTTQLLNLNIY